MSRPAAGAIARVAMAVGLTLFVLWKSDPGAVLSSVAGADWRFLAICFGLVAVDRALMAYRWVRLLGPFPADRRPPMAAVLRVFFVSTFVGTFLPASVGGDAVRALSLARLGAPAALSAASVFMDRALGVLSILVMAMVGLLLARQLIANAAVQTAVMVIGLGCGATALLVFSQRTADAVAALAARVPAPRVARIAQSLIAAVRGYGHHRKALALVLAVSVAVQVLRIAQAYFVGRALSIEIGARPYFAFVPLILLVMLLPITVNGLGTGQVAFVWFFAQAGVSSADAFALSIVFASLGLIGNLPGAVLYAAKRSPPEGT